MTMLDWDLIHIYHRRSAKSLETIVGLFYDYCQVANAMSSIHKRLAKAMKEAVGLKATTQISGE